MLLNLLQTHIFCHTYRYLFVMLSGLWLSAIAFLIHAPVPSFVPLKKISSDDQHDGYLDGQDPQNIMLARITYSCLLAISFTVTLLISHCSKVKIDSRYNNYFASNYLQSIDKKLFLSNKYDDTVDVTQTEDTRWNNPEVNDI